MVCGTSRVWCPLAIRPVVTVVSKIAETTVGIAMTTCSKIVEAMTTLQVYKPDSI